MTNVTRRVGSGFYALAAALMLAACGGGAGGGSSIADGGIRGTGKSVGPVSGFGSVIVNGTRYETDRADFVVNDERAIQDHLSEGMVVVVEVSDEDDDRADGIQYSDDLRGPLAGEFDPLSNRLVVLGQTVRFNSSTVFRGLSRANPANGAPYVRVSGWYLDSGELLASYVHFGEVFDLVEDDVKIRGTISGFNGDNSLQIVSQRVVYTQNTDIEMGDNRDNFVQEDVGAFVEVEGELDATGNLKARKIEQEDRDDRLGDISSGTGIRIEGSLTTDIDKTPSGTFQINGVRVRVNPATDLQGRDITELTQGTRVYIEGVGNTEATVVAKRVEIREPDAEANGTITAIEPSVDNPEREGHLVVGGVRVEVTLRTITVDDDADSDNRKLRFADLRPGDFVEVAGILRQSDEGAYIEAVKLERDDDGGNDSGGSGDDDEEDGED